MRSAEWAEFTIPLWDWEMLVVRGGNAATFNTFARLKGNDEVDCPDGCAGFSYFHESRVEPSFVWIKDRFDIPVLAHELLHVTVGILTYVGVSLSSKSEETFTYTLQTLMREVLDCERWYPLRPVR